MFLDQGYNLDKDWELRDIEAYTYISSNNHQKALWSISLVVSNSSSIFSLPLAYSPPTSRNNAMLRISREQSIINAALLSSLFPAVAICRMDNRIYIGLDDLLIYSSAHPEEYLFYNHLDPEPGTYLLKIVKAFCLSDIGKAVFLTKSGNQEKNRQESQQQTSSRL